MGICYGSDFRMLRVLIKLENQKIYDSKGKELKGLEGPILVVSEKSEEGGFKNILIKSFEGDFERIEEYSYDNKDKQKISGVSLIMSDEGEEYQLRIAWNTVARSLVNSLAGTEVPLGRLTIKVWGNTKGDKTFSCIGVYNDGQQTNWKFSPDEQKTMIKKIETSKGVIADYGQYEETLKLLLQNINKNKKVLDEVIPF